MISLSFLYFFLPVFVALYFVFPKALKSRFVLLTSTGLIFWAEPLGLIPMAICIFSGYLFGIFIHNFREKAVSKVLLGLEIAVNVGVFLLFHRTAYDGSDLLTVLGQNSLIKNTAVIGASVMPLHSIGYCIDIYRRRYVCEHRFIVVAEYIAFFPCFAAGPILKFDRFRDELDKADISAEKCAAGIRMLLLGFFMKLFISNTMYKLWNEVREIPLKSLPTLSAWIGILSFAFFIYFEVNAYSNIACGLASLMGIRLPRNFREPYKSRSFIDFCSKFNRTLYRWCIDYVYRSIKCGAESGIKEFFAIIVTVTAAVLWYGTAMRSVLFAAALIFMLCFEKLLEKQLKKLPKPICRILFIFMLMVIMPFLSFTEPMEAIKFISAMFGGNHVAVDMTSEYLLGTYIMFVILCLLISSGIFGFVFKKKVFNNEYLQTVIQPVWVIALLIFCTAFLVSEDSSMFTYML